MYSRKKYDYSYSKKYYTKTLTPLPSFHHRIVYVNCARTIFNISPILAKKFDANHALDCKRFFVTGRNDEICDELIDIL